MTRLVAGGVALVLGTEVLALLFGDHSLIPVIAGVAVALTLLAVRLDLGAVGRPQADDPVRDDAAELLKRWKSQTEALIKWADSSRADWDRHLRPRLAREFMTATRQMDSQSVQSTGHMVFGAELWQWVDPGNISAHGSGEPGPGSAVLDEILRRMEQV